MVRENLAENDFEGEEIEGLMGVLEAHLKPEYLKAAVREAEEIMAKMTEDEEPARDTFRDISTAAQGSLRSGLFQTNQREKAKTRPGNPLATVPAVEDPGSLDIVTFSIEPMVRIRVSQRTLDVVHLIYPESQTRPRNITWDDFVHALCDAGFVASNNGGSAVRFELGSGSDRGDKGAIIFHKPHPVLKIVPIMLHGMGRRLTKWFGWNCDCFEARGAQED
ncbi:hypothetical protein CORC01_09009 [Colletotrichum orchidophilum]|uniref:Uncharacterized protein n=1 Tax=Colletotrichum orchidophilum TaxID=1209926 RepID=A0A1G4B327_9PEZI|nr:uncharacterized protein CORC01_09009 [Colletotrichum orchidophilum]OHE95725.1 hypothetical protein CORC01_09009 [Colletotrichum orchidophilum]